MPLKPIFDKAPLTAMNCQPLHAGLVRTDSAVLCNLYATARENKSPVMMEGLFRLACIVCPRPLDEPVTALIRDLLAAQNEDGSFVCSHAQSVAVLRAAWALYEYEARKPLLEHIARWCAYAAQHWDDVMAEDEIWSAPADLFELLENLYRVTGKAALLSLCEKLASQSMSWSGILNTLAAQRPVNKESASNELLQAMKAENSRDGYHHLYFRSNHPETLADGARSAMMKGWYTGSATELNAARNGWERLQRYHGAICGALTSDEMLEGTATNAAISTASLGAWAEALCNAAQGEKNAWAWDAIERMVLNAMPAVVENGSVLPFQRVNTLGQQVDASDCFIVSDDHNMRALNRLVRGYAAVTSSAVTACSDGAAVNLYLPGRYAVMIGDTVLILTVTSSEKGSAITVHCKQETKASIRLRVPSWSKNTEITVNGAHSSAEVMNDTIVCERVWHDGDTIEIALEPMVRVVDGHHQGKYIMKGAILMALAADVNTWAKTFVSVQTSDGKVSAILDGVKDWKLKGQDPADIPVLPSSEGTEATFSLVPYARTRARIAIFPGRKQA